MGYVGNTTVALSVGGIDIAAVTSIGWTGAGQDPVEVTAFDNTGNYREYVRGLIEPGEIPFEANYLPANASHTVATSGLLFELTNSGAHSALIFTLPDATAQTFPVILSNIEISPIAPGTLLKITGTFKVTGQPTTLT
jgi:hypothetical protein